MWFTHAEGLTTRGQELGGFEVAGDDHAFVPATAKIENVGESETVVVSSPQVTFPRFVRYDWSGGGDDIPLQQRRLAGGQLHLGVGRVSIVRESVAGAPLTVRLHCHRFAFTMTDTYDFDKLLKEYRTAVDNYCAAIKAEEALANDDHSMVEMEKWDAAGFASHDAEALAKKARDHYKNALRKKNYGF